MLDQDQPNSHGMTTVFKGILYYLNTMLVKEYPEYIGHFLLEFFFYNKKIPVKMTNTFRVLVDVSNL